MYNGNYNGNYTHIYLSRLKYVSNSNGRAERCVDCILYTITLLGMGSLTKVPGAVINYHMSPGVRISLSTSAMVSSIHFLSATHTGPTLLKAEGLSGSVQVTSLSN